MRAEAQVTPALEDQLTALWKEKKHLEIGVLLDSKIDADASDVVALHAASFFYVWIKPNKAKALSAIGKLKSYAETTREVDFIAFANEELAKINGLPDEEFNQSRENFLILLHEDISPNEYPMIFLSVGMRKYKVPSN